MCICMLVCIHNCLQRLHVHVTAGKMFVCIVYITCAAAGWAGTGGDSMPFSDLKVFTFVCIILEAKYVVGIISKTCRYYIRIL